MAITVRTSLDDLPKALGNFFDQVPFATSQALNDTGFGLMREMRGEVRDQLTNRNRFTERSVRVDKASKGKLVARVGSLAWYMGDLVTGGEHTPGNVAGRATGKAGDVGYLYKGRRYLLVPEHDRRTKSGRMRKLRNKPFVVEGKDGKLWLMAQKGRRRNPLLVIGQLVPETQYKAGTFDWDGPSEVYVRRHWERNFKKAMLRAARSAK